MRVPRKDIRMHSVADAAFLGDGIECDITANTTREQPNLRIEPQRGNQLLELGDGFGVGQHEETLGLRPNIGQVQVAGKENTSLGIRSRDEKGQRKIEMPCGIHANDTQIFPHPDQHPIHKKLQILFHASHRATQDNVTARRLLETRKRCARLTAQNLESTHGLGIQRKN